MRILNRILVLVIVGLGIFLFFIPKQNEVSAQCCCRWYSCGYIGGNYSCCCPGDSAYECSVRGERCTSGCTDYSCSCGGGGGGGGGCTETNVKTSAPTSISIRVRNAFTGDYVAYSLSSSSSSPTTIIMACASTSTPRAQIYVPSKTAPSTSSGLGYSYRANNYGVDNEWLAYSCDRPEDFCLSDSTTRIRNFAPNTYSVPAVLKEGAKGLIRGRYYTIDKCDNDKIYSDWRIGYYEVETNTVPQPTSGNRVTLKIDGQSHTLPVDSAQRITVKQPSADNNVEVNIPTKTKPSTSSELGYIFRTTNDPSGPYNTEGLTNTLPFTPTGGARSYLKETSTGNVRGIYYTKNRCGLNKIDTALTPINGYYRINNGPDIICPCDPSILVDDINCVCCSCIPEIKKSDPNCICCEYNENILPDDPDCDEDTPVPPYECPPGDPKCPILPAIGSDITAKGCRSTDYTGKEINNPLEIRISATDENDIEEVRGAIVWFNKQGEAVSSKYVVEIEDSFNNNASPNNIAVMIVRSDSSWENAPSIYAYRSDGKWGKLGDSNAFTVGEGDQFTEITVSVDKISEGNDLITFDLSLLFDNSSSSTLNGMYDFKSLVVDRYMIFTDDSNKDKVDLSGMKTYFEWGIDLKTPTVGSLSPETSGLTQISVDVDSDGTGSNITDLVINGYKRGGSTVNSSISLTQPSGISNLIELLSEPPPDKIGVLGDLNSWWLSSLSQSPYSQEFKIDIGQNEGGTISIYATAFDQGCNDSMGRFTIDLSSWVVTKGGVIYTKDGFVSSAKNLSEVGDMDITLKTFPVGQHIFTRMTTGSELISSRQEAVQDLIYGNTDFVRAVRANRVYDSMDKKNYWFEYLRKKLEERKTEGLLTSFSIVGTKVSDYCPPEGVNCYMESLEEDIVIPKDYVCDKNTLFISHKNIIIDPDVTVPTEENTDNIKGCIFLAKDKIIVKGGDHISDTKVKYDYIEGFLIAEDQVLLELVDTDEDIRDGLEIKGGVVAFGRESEGSSGLLIDRNLRLFNTYNPALVISWDVRYAKLSEIFFGTEAPMYKQEVGFKAY